MKQTIKRLFSFVLTLLIVLGLSSCGQKADTTSWEEQYDLGVRYLSEGNYEEAIIAFTAAIEIDPKKPDTYLGLYEAYIGIGDYKAARTILEQGIEETSDSSIADMLSEFKNEMEYGPLIRTFDLYVPSRDSQQQACLIKTTFEYYQSGTVREIQYNENGNVEFENLYDYLDDVNTTSHYFYGELESAFSLDADGLVVSEIWYTRGSYNGAEYIVKEFDDQGRLTMWTEYTADDAVKGYTSHSYHTNGIPQKEENYLSGSGWLLMYEFDVEGKEIRQVSSHNGELTYDWRFEYDDAGVRYKGTNYDADGEIEYYEIYEYDNAGNRTGLTRYTADGELMY